MITCAAEDALYFKKILTTMAEQEKLNTGKFIPSGLHLVAGPSIVTNLLKNHNFYVDKLTAVAIEGIPMEAMIAEEHFVSEKRTKGTLMEKFTQMSQVLSRLKKQVPRKKQENGLLLSKRRM